MVGNGVKKALNFEFQHEHETGIILLFIKLVFSLPFPQRINFLHKMALITNNIYYLK